MIRVHGSNRNFPFKDIAALFNHSFNLLIIYRIARNSDLSVRYIDNDILDSRNVFDAIFNM